MGIAVSARLDENTLKRLEALAKATERSKSYLMAEAIRNYLDQQAWQVEAIREGLAQADAGRFVDPERVEDFFRQRLGNEG